MLDSGDIRVKYSGGRTYTINHNAITKVPRNPFQVYVNHYCLLQVTCFSTGDIIRVVNDIAAVHSFQENHGGWVDDMALVSYI